MSRDESNRQRRAEAKAAARRLVREHGLPMKVIGVDYLDEPNVFTIYFGAPHRVDFRELVRDLAGRLRARVELRQIGPRDEARLQGGIGPCGRDLCCATFLKDFEPVSVRMAKDQDLPVNPLRIAGACGRLMCCLKYEHPLYQDFRAKAPEARRDRGDARGRRHGRGPQRARPTRSWSSWPRTAAAAPAPRPASADPARPTRRCTVMRATPRLTGRLLPAAALRAAGRLSSVGRAIHS